jgi:hypothetical protein|tara:strand:+ start:18 stop:254 length:237 start_codon:yes stop_codon:yes gene_type:complete
MEGDTLMANNISPSYYQKGSIEVTDYITSNEMSFVEGNIIKYVTRYKEKSGIQDLRKARWYLDKLIETQMDIPMEDMK